ncbi:MAG: hypothetical protein ACE363_14760 [Alphaproteobacteria bacterium]
MNARTIIFTCAAGIAVLSSASTLAQESIGVVSTTGKASPPWADPEFPEIDYGAGYARDLGEAGASFRGWWGMIDERPSKNEAGHAIVFNFSRMDKPDSPDAAVLMAICSGDDTYLAYFPRKMEAATAQGQSPGETLAENDQPRDATTWAAAKSAKRERSVEFQIDGNSSNRETWLLTTLGNGVFTSGDGAADILQRLGAASSLTLTLKNAGEAVTTSFDLTGANPALPMLKESCMQSGTVDSVAK